jgi:hypothetical protein
MAPPAFTPVPLEAGLRNTLAPPNFPYCSWGMVPLVNGYLDQVLLGILHAFGDRSGNFTGLSEPMPNYTVLITNYYDGRETEGTPPLGHLGHTLDAYQAVL